jgi:hypothetical protein
MGYDKLVKQLLKHILCFENQDLNKNEIKCIIYILSFEKAFFGIIYGITDTQASISLHVYSYCSQILVTYSLKY